MAALAAACELPALSFLVVVMTMCLLRNVTKTLLAFLPPVLLVIAGFFVTNYTAHQDWQPAYAHRTDGPVLTIVNQIDSTGLERGEISQPLRDSLMAVRADLKPESFDDIQILEGGWPLDEIKANARWIVYFDEKTLPLVLVERADRFGVAVHEWNNWYEYPGSYWLKQNEAKSRLDLGEPRWDRYLFHLTLGHHGVFSLTPVWFLSIFGMLTLCVSRRYRLRLLAMAIVAISIIVIAFYVTRPIEDRNYGGWCCGAKMVVLADSAVAVGDDPGTRCDQRKSPNAIRRAGAACDQYRSVFLCLVEPMGASVDLRDDRRRLIWQNPAREPARESTCPNRVDSVRFC